ncbi:hypothetical protein B0H11DRAFT_2351367 [Mycena galericulata]|nr:hypothetical protein B0H11DRAFT_2351367 [Mycena galericulata]
MPHILSMYRFHSLLVSAFALLVVLAPASGSPHLEAGRYPTSSSTRRAPPSSASCQPISVAELQAMPFWQTFYQRLGVIVWGNPHAFDFVRPSFNLETTFDDGSGNARVCSENTVVFQTAGSAVCFSTTTYSKESVAGASGDLRFDYPSGFSTVVNGAVTKVAAPLTGGRTYETVFRVQDASPPKSNPSEMYTVNSPYADAQGHSFEVHANHEQMKYIQIHENPGDICSIYYTNSTCIQNASGQVTFSLEGAVRVGFNSRQNGHYYWYLWFAGWVPGDQLNIDSQFDATITTTGSNDYSPGYNCHH